MSTPAPNQADQQPTVPTSGEQLARRCARCGLAYAPGKSTSALRLTYCSFLCELGDLGFSISGLEHMERKPGEPEVADDTAAEAAPSESSEA